MVLRRPGFLSFWRPALVENQRGSSLVEFAFAAPLVVLMLIAIIEFGMIMFVSTLMESALRDAARFGITGQEPEGGTRLEQIIAIVEDRTIGLVDMAGFTLPSATSGGAKPSSTATATAPTIRARPSPTRTATAPTMRTSARPGPARPGRSSPTVWNTPGRCARRWRGL